MGKGVSTIIAVIILLIITISLAGTAYLFIYGMLTSHMSQSISVLGASCNGTHITLVVSNTGTENITDTEIKIYVNEQDAGTFGKTIGPHESEVETGIGTGIVEDGPNTLLVVSPSSSITETVWC